MRKGLASTGVSCLAHHGQHFITKCTIYDVVIALGTITDIQNKESLIVCVSNKFLTFIFEDLLQKAKLFDDKGQTVKQCQALKAFCY